jgi:hypothetical protein
MSESRVIYGHVPPFDTVVNQPKYDPPFYDEHNVEYAETEDKMVSHPPHYQTPNGLEAIDVIEAFTANLQGIEATDTGNVLKYMCRWKSKNGLQDLKKAKWYLEHLINHVEKENENNGK